MRIGTYVIEGAEPRAFVGVEDGIVDIHKASEGRLPPSIIDLLGTDDWMAQLGRLLESDPGPDHRLEDVRLLPPIPRPGKILAAAGNYQAHIDEGGGIKVDVSRRTPRVFIKPSTALIGQGDAIVLPSVSDETDWELELAVVIGQGGRNIDVGQALDHVAGYTILNDVSARSMSWGIEDREVHDWDKFFDWLMGKWVDTFSPVGPWIVTSDEIPDPHVLDLRLELNGEVWQHASTADMIFDCSDLIAYVSRFSTLEPGDIIATGTPSGIGAASGRYLRSGDVMVGTIEKIGTLRTPVVER